MTRITNPGLFPECWDAFDSDDESSGHVEDEHHAIFHCSGNVYAREHAFSGGSGPEPYHYCQPISEPAPMQSSCQVCDGDQDIAHERSLV